MTCAFCSNTEGVRLRMVPSRLITPALATKIELCPDCWADLQQVITPRRQES